MWKQDHFHTRKASWSEKLYFTMVKGSGSRWKGRKESQKSNKQLLNCSSHSSFAEPWNGWGQPLADIHLDMPAQDHVQAAFEHL